MHTYSAELGYPDQLQSCYLLTRVHGLLIKYLLTRVHGLLIKYSVLLFVMQGRVYFDKDGIRGGRRLFIYQMRYNENGR